MRAFACPSCRSLVFFENTRCVTCQSSLAYDRAAGEIVVVTDENARCRNQMVAGCNWLAGEELNGYCGSCWLTRTRPSGDDAGSQDSYLRTEAAKRRLVYQLDHLGLPVTPRADDPEHGLAFDLLSSRDQKVITGHNSGVITLDLAEGEDPHREALRVQLAEPYRTLLGHLRHEIGHWYWDVLVDGTGFLDGFRDLFGDDRVNYGQALKEHYSTPVDDAWVRTHVSNYAASHPWEDWAETFAHYLHIRDTMDTANAWGVRVDGPDLDLNLAWNARLDVEPDDQMESFDELAQTWIAFAMATNALNRSMGKDDLYPFRLPPAVLEKMRFVHVVVTSHR